MAAAVEKDGEGGVKQAANVEREGTRSEVEAEGERAVARVPEVGPLPDPPPSIPAPPWPGRADTGS